MAEPVSTVVLPASVRREPGHGGLACLSTSTPLATAEVYLQGAHLTAWKPADQSPVLWVSGQSVFAPGKAIRGGVPICFPWFAAQATDPKAPGHGFARTRSWTLVAAREMANGSVTLSLALEDDESTRAGAWPHRFRATFTIEIGRTLTMALAVENRDVVPVMFEEALHTYFAVHDVRDIDITGLENTAYLDKVQQMAERRPSVEPIRFTGETDRIYLDTRADCVIHDPGMRRRIVISKTGSETTVVWNPWVDKARALSDFGDDEWPEMVCVETCNVSVHAVTLAPGEQHLMSATIDVDDAIPFAPRRQAE
jgi:glucose-6-phosphate 1-epimerase